MTARRKLALQTNTLGLLLFFRPERVHAMVRHWLATCSELQAGGGDGSRGYPVVTPTICFAALLQHLAALNRTHKCALALDVTRLNPPQFFCSFFPLDLQLGVTESFLPGEVKELLGEIIELQLQPRGEDLTAHPFLHATRASIGGHLQLHEFTGDARLSGYVSSDYLVQAACTLFVQDWFKLDVAHDLGTTQYLFQHVALTLADLAVEHAGREPEGLQRLARTFAKAVAAPAESLEDYAPLGMALDVELEKMDTKYLTAFREAREKLVL